ncbi:hypothetical protein Poly41_03700 [Novipirellula artificiosorum]|uniref:Uncharacterized protein n=2 Tax=Novipirellula artificiosorum TaxID=2528016 RepID=A0A5C6E0P8_9BACT|nr:hypothetical protein Poly41_03700 [Novipirellula artificiosorum]
MLSRPSKRISLALISVVIGVVGCRSPRTIGSLFQVTRHESAELSDVEAPRQRLATAKPRAGSVFGSAEATDPEEESLIRQVSHTDEAPLARTQKLPVSTKQANAAEARADAAEGMSKQELLEQLEGMSPEVKELALRQWNALANHHVESTAQPAPLDQALAKSLKHEHQLPPAKNEPASAPLKRLAMPAEETPTKDVFAEDTAEAIAAQNAASDLEEVVVTTITDTKLESKPEAIKPVSATRRQDDPRMVSTASMQSPTATEAAASIDSLSDKTLYEALLKRIAMPVDGESDAEHARRLITARHLMVLAGNPDAAVERIEGMTDKEQEYLRHQLLGLWTMVDPEGHPVQSRRFSSALPQLREATKYLAAATDSLEVRSLAFCTEIMAYGQTKPFPTTQFQPGQQVILYCEVENFVAKKVENGFQTHLQGSYDVLNSENQKVASQLLPADQQISANYLRDYFIAYQMHLPQNLAEGKYRLQLTMEDIEGKKYGQSNIAFEIK